MGTLVRWTGNLVIALVLTLVASATALAADVAGARQAVEEGRKALESGDVAGAVAQFRKAVDKDPANSEGHFKLAVTLQKLDDLSEVEQQLQVAQAAGYDKAEIEAALAELFNRLGRFGRVLDEIPEGKR